MSTFVEELLFQEAMLVFNTNFRKDILFHYFSKTLNRIRDVHGGATTAAAVAAIPFIVAVRQPSGIKRICYDRYLY
jgi:hypothetical protein